jgi:hypothetical protein
LELNKKALLKIPFMSRDDAHKFLAKEDLLYKGIRRTAVDHYDLQANRNKCPPAINGPNSKAPPNRFGANVAIAETSVKDIIANVLQVFQTKTNVYGVGLPDAAAPSRALVNVAPSPTRCTVEREIS